MAAQLFVKQNGVWVAATSISGGGTGPAELRINAGGSSVTVDGIVYDTDAYFIGGTAYATADSAQLTALPAQLESARYGMSSYKIPAYGRVLIRLHMVEYDFSTSGQRVFNIYANGGLVVQNLDLFAAAGRGNPVSRDIVLDPVNGYVTIGFVSSKDNPIVSALEVLDGAGMTVTPVITAGTLPAAPTNLAATSSTTQISLSWTAPSGTISSYRVYRDGSLIGSPTTTTYADSSAVQGATYSYTVSAVNTAGEGPQGTAVNAALSPTTPTSAIRINAGGAATTVDAVEYAADNYYSGGSVFTTTDPNQLSALPTHLESARYGMSSYRFPASSRTLVRLHMVEYTFAASGRRIFDVFANGGLVIDNMDIFAAAGQGTPVSRDIVLDPVDGYVTIGFTASVDNSIVSAIEVLDGTGMTLTPVITPTVTEPSPGTGMLAYATQDFVETCGVAVHMTYSGQYGNLAGNATDQQRFVDMMTYLRMNRIRDGWGYNRDGIVNFVKGKLAPALGGVEFSLTHDSRDWGLSFGTAATLTDTKKWVAEHKRTGMLQYLKWAEGCNEWDLGSAPIAQAKTTAINVKQAYSEEPTAGHVLVGSMSFANTIEPSRYDKHGLASSLDFGTPHDYTGNSYQMNDWIMGEVEKNYGKIAPGKPVISTETDITNGTTNGGYKGIPESLGSTFSPRVYMDHWIWGRADQLHGSNIQQKGGIVFARTYKYELINKSDGSGGTGGTNFESNFGFFRYDRTPKPAATAMRNLIGLMLDSGAKPARSRLNLTFSGAASNTKGSLFKKSDGSYWLVMWQQEKMYDGNVELNPAPVSITVNLPAAASTVRYYKPRLGTSATNTFTNTSTLTVSNSKEITVIELVGLP